MAAFMELALYDPDIGYYARASRRSGRAGDFFTSVDVGSVFGELLAAQIAEMSDILRSQVSSHTSQVNAGAEIPDIRLETSDLRLQTSDVLDLVEVGAGNGRLSADMLRTLRHERPDVYERTRLHLVEASAAARSAHRATLDDVADRLASSSAAMPDAIDGVIVANELLDALPVHQAVMRREGLREVYVDRQRGAEASDGAMTTIEGPPSTPALADYLDRLGVRLDVGSRVEINLRAVEWIRDAARRLRRGFVILVDYGHEARDLYSASHSAGTLTTFARHTMTGPESGDLPAWLRRPGEQDITAHVDFTSVRQAAEAEGLQVLGFLDQTYFLLGLVKDRPAFSTDQNAQPSSAPPLLRPLMQLKTLLMPGGLGSSHKVLLLARNVGTPALAGCSFRVRVT